MPSAKPSLPGTLARSEPHARRLWLKTRAAAEKTYGAAGAAARVAYAALKHEYEKRGDRWVRRPAPHSARKSR